LSSSSGRDDGWAAEAKRLLERHPRSRWPDEGTPHVAFWLEVHGRLRRDSLGLDAAGDEHRAGRTSAAQLLAIATARLRGLSAALHGHHRIEDFEYFPAFRRAEPRLAAGFDRLAAEHALLTRDVAATERALAQLRAALERTAGADGAAPAIAAERYAAAARQLCARLRAHLADEEDLVVPLLIETDR
jgi:hypothetical protein